MLSLCQIQYLSIFHITEVVSVNFLQENNVAHAQRLFSQLILCSKFSNDVYNNNFLLKFQHVLYWMVVSAMTRFNLTYVFALPFQKHGPRMKCSACKIIAHTSCINVLMERTKFYCKATFRDVGVRQYREQTCIHHHWVHRRSQKGKCKQCGKV